MTPAEHQKQTLAFVSAKLGLPVTIEDRQFNELAATGQQAIDVAKDFERLWIAECRERAILETAATEAIHWLHLNAPGRATETLGAALCAIQAEMKQ